MEMEQLPVRKLKEIYYTITKWNYYLQWLDIVERNNQKPLLKFLNGKNANNKVNYWSLELATL